MFDFIIRYEDGSMKNERTPYRGEKIDEESLRGFVEGYFAGITPKPHSIEIGGIREYDDEKEWLTEAKETVAFKGLYEMIGFAGDLMKKHFPDEIDKVGGK